MKLEPFIPSFIIRKKKFPWMSLFQKISSLKYRRLSFPNKKRYYVIISSARYET